MSFFRDLRIAVRSLARVPALWNTVALTLALGIGANTAIFIVVRAVLLRPLANRDEAHPKTLDHRRPNGTDISTDDGKKLAPSETLIHRPHRRR
jgi:hypothetical protein